MRTAPHTRRATARRIAFALAGVVATLAACGSPPETLDPPTTSQVTTAELTGSAVDAWLDEVLPAALEEGRIAAQGS